MASAKILDNYLRRQAVAAQLQRQSMAIGKVLEKGQEGLAEALNQRSKQQDKDLFELPPLPQEESGLNQRYTFPYYPLSACQTYLPLISAPTGFLDWVLVTRSAQLQVT